MYGSWPFSCAFAGPIHDTCMSRTWAVPCRGAAERPESPERGHGAQAGLLLLLKALLAAGRQHESLATRPGSPAEQAVHVAILAAQAVAAAGALHYSVQQLLSGLQTRLHFEPQLSAKESPQ